MSNRSFFVSKHSLVKIQIPTQRVSEFKTRKNKPIGKVSLTRNLGCGAVLTETGIKVCPLKQTVLFESTIIHDQMKL